MRLVMKFSVSDGCTYGYEAVLPIEYESPEAAIVEFEELAVKAREAGEPTFIFAGHEEETWCHFEEGVYYSPSFLTIDEWFAQA